MNKQQIAQLQITQLLDEAALRKAAELYAQGADRRHKPTWAAIVTEGCIIEGPGFTMTGRDQVVGSLDILASMFFMTQHRVQNQIVTINGDRAEGETYCVADHLSKVDGKTNILVWAIRYQDQWQREDGKWRFSHRKLIIDWTETRIID